MSNLNKLIMNIEEKVFGCDLDNIITQSNTLQEAQNIVTSFFEKELMSYEIDIAKDVVSRSWNEYWGDYV